MNALVDMLRKAGTEASNVAALRRASSVLYVVTKVRGFKTVVKFFPHEVVDLELCLNILRSQDASDHEVCSLYSLFHLGRHPQACANPSARLSLLLHPSLNLLSASPHPSLPSFLPTLLPPCLESILSLSLHHTGIDNQRTAMARKPRAKSLESMKTYMYYKPPRRRALSQTWETRYVLLLWLSMLVIVPFDLSTIDSMLSSGSALPGETETQHITHYRVASSTLMRP